MRYYNDMLFNFIPQNVTELIHISGKKTQKENEIILKKTKENKQ